MQTLHQGVDGARVKPPSGAVGHAQRRFEAMRDLDDGLETHHRRQSLYRVQRTVELAHRPGTGLPALGIGLHLQQVLAGPAEVLVRLHHETVEEIIQVHTTSRAVRLIAHVSPALPASKAPTSATMA